MKAEIILHNFFRTHCVFENYRIDTSAKNDIYFLRVSDATSREVPSEWRHGQRDVVFRITFVIKQVWIQANASSPRSSYLRVMAAVTTSKQTAPTTNDLKAKVPDKLFNPFYSPPGDDDGNETYQYAEFKVRMLDSSYLFY